MTSSPNPAATDRDTGPDERKPTRTPAIRRTASSFFSASHAAPNGAGVKALRPLRGRAPPEP